LKIAIINDQHFGARNDSPIFLEYFEKFYKEIFFPYIKENNIDTVISLGDFFDRRKYINFKTLNHVKEMFLNIIEQEKINVHMILGNHDCFFKNTNSLNSVCELLKPYETIKVYENPEVIELGGLSFAMMSWINKENYEESIEFIKTANAPIFCGHLELDGYEVMPGVDWHGNMSSDIFKRYEKVLSGHFHQKSHRDNVYYLGTQYQITFTDLNVKKGFYVIDTETRDLEFIENPNSIFHSVSYDDSLSDEEPTELIQTFSKYKNCFVKIYVVNKQNPVMFDKFLEALNNAQPANITIIEEFDTETDEEDVDLSKNTIELINDEIDLMPNIKNPNKLKKIVKELYLESLKI
jgi:DNA repair exonuclease SbcCD nuclease subunit